MAIEPLTNGLICMPETCRYDAETDPPANRLIAIDYNI